MIGVLHWALVYGYDIECEAPVTEELLYRIQEILVPALVAGDTRLHFITITCPTARTEIENESAIGGGMSCGIDSFYMAASHYHSKYEKHNLTHLILNNIGAFHNRSQYQWQIEHAKQVADAMKLPLIITDSNLANVFPESHILSHTYRNLSAIHHLKKLFGTFYYSSSGHNLNNFTLKDNSRNACEKYDLLTCQCLSTHSLQFFSDGCTKTRWEKTQILAKFPLARHYLHVCVSDTGGNCGFCMKCKRTLLMLDALGYLEDFSVVFDIPKYRTNRGNYLAYLYAQKLLGIHGDDMLKEVFPILKTDISLKKKLLGAYLALRTLCANIELLKHLYHKMIIRDI